MLDKSIVPIAAQRLTAFSRAAAIFAASIAGVVLLGWIFDVAVLRSVLPDLPTMKPNTAFCFLFASMSLWLWHRADTGAGRHGGIARTTAVVLAVAVTIVAGITLSQDVFGWNSGLDQLVFNVPATDVASPGRMAPGTAMGFIVLGCALMLLAVPARWAVALVQLIGAISVGMSLLLLLAYLFDADIVRVRPYSSLSIPTAVDFLLLSAGITTLRGNAGWVRVFTRDTNSARIGRQSVLSVLVVLPLIAWLCVIGARDFGQFGVYFGIAILAISSIAALIMLSWLGTQDGNEADEEIINLNRVYAVLSGINTLIVHVRSREELFRKACKVAWRVGKFPWVWIAEIEPGQSHGALVACQGGSEELVLLEQQRVGSEAADNGENWLMRRVIDSRAPLVLNDLYDPEGLSEAEYRLLEPYRAAGIRGLVMLPIIVAGDVIGVFALHADEPGFFDDMEMGLLVELAGDIGFALQNLEKDATLDYLSYYDPLTGLANRQYFVDLVGRGMKAAGQASRRIKLVLMDLRRFRMINETFGRGAGDTLLKDVTERLRASVPEPETLARVHGDYFATIVSSQLDRPLDYRLEQVFNAGLHEPFSVGGQRLNVQATYGVAIYPGDGVDAESLLSNAEAALKKAKETGQEFLYYEPEINARVAEALRLESKLRSALELGQFVLHYQPKVNFETGKVHGVEALLRWQDPDIGLVPPNDFIPLLEQTGLIMPVGQWVMRQAVSDIMKCKSLGLQPPRVAINVSAIQLRETSFTESMVSALRRMNGDEPLLDVEITESLVMEDVRRAGKALRELRDIGVQVAIDDFGTGYSSLAYLARLPLNTIKIDRSFVVGMARPNEGVAIVSAIISLANALNATVVAEGVETEEQAATLNGLGCDLMQGNLYSKPVPFDELTSMLTDAPLR